MIRLENHAAQTSRAPGLLQRAVVDLAQQSPQNGHRDHQVEHTEDDLTLYTRSNDAVTPDRNVLPNQRPLLSPRRVG